FQDSVFALNRDFESIVVEFRYLHHWLDHGQMPKNRNFGVVSPTRLRAGAWPPLLDAAGRLSARPQARAGSHHREDQIRRSMPAEPRLAWYLHSLPPIGWKCPWRRNQYP